MAYTGPGDIHTFNAWWGLRAYSASSAGNNCADVTAISGGIATTIKTLANGSFDLASASSALLSGTGYISKLYDQTGNGIDLVQATGVNQPIINLSSVSGTLPEIQFTESAFVTERWMATAATTFTVSSPWSIVGVLKPVSFNSARTFIGDSPAAAGAGGQGFYYSSSTGIAFFYNSFAGTTETVSTGVYSRLIGWNNAASSAFVINGSVNTFTGDTSAWTGGVDVGDSIGENTWNAVEYGIASGSLSSVASSLDSNINNYWFVASSGSTATVSYYLTLVGVGA